LTPEERTLSKKLKRDLSVILDDIEAILKSDTANVIRIGNLLIEAKKQVLHGEWLPLLKERFDFSDRTARNYIKAAKFAASKSETISDLRIAPLVLYALAAGDKFPEGVEERILKAAAGERIDMNRAMEIHDARLAELASKDQDRWTEATAEQEDEKARLEAKTDAQREVDAAAKVAAMKAEIEASAEARKAQYARADEDEDEKPAALEDQGEAEGPVKKCITLTRVQLMAIAAQVSQLAIPGDYDLTTDIEVINPDLELHDALNAALDSLRSAVWSVSQCPGVREQLNARYQAECEQQKAKAKERRAEVRAFQKKLRAEEAAEGKAA
jgi:hypothetical protein